jgi:aspartyl-tRNA(Asn)/glutamyl-tRNA(Gln) amidotransferase subunit B
MIRMIGAGVISGTSGKTVFEKMWATGETPQAIVEREGLTQVSDSAAIEAAIAAIVAAHPQQVATYKGGKASTLGWFVGQVMRTMGGKANPQLVNELLRKVLD